MHKDEQAERRSAIAYIMRRRKRIGKTRANSGAPVKTWAEYRNVSHTPSGSSGFWMRLLLLLMLPLIAGAPVVIISLSESAIELSHREVDPVTLTIVAFVGVLLLVAFLLVAVVIAKSLSNIVLGRR